MTLIAPTISDLGIVQASDSNLTDSQGNLVGTGDKLFRLGFCPGVLALAGTYVINGIDMEMWMPSAISAYSLSPLPSLEGFARHPAERLESEQDVGITALLGAHSMSANGGFDSIIFFGLNVGQRKEGLLFQIVASHVAR